MTEYTVQADQDADVIYQGDCKIGSYSQTNAGSQIFTLKDFSDDDQFKKIIHEVDANTPVILMGGVGSDMYFNRWNLMLKSAKDGAQTGPVLRFEFPELDDDAYDTVKSLKYSKAELFVVIIKGEIFIKKKQPKGEHGAFARRLMASHLLLMPEFLSLVGSEDQFSTWLQKQKCAATGSFHKHEVTGEELCEVAHVRDVNWGAGISRKPPYYAIPLVRKVHQAQHEKGMVYVWNHYLDRRVPKNIPFPIHDELSIVKMWFASKAQNYMRLWVKSEVTKYHNVPSLSFVSENMFKQYLTNISALDMIRFL